jgi:hypothetical protein
MPLYVKNSANVIETIYHYSTTAELNGADISQSYRLNVQTSSGTRYIGLIYCGQSTPFDCSSPIASNLRIIAPNGVAYAVATVSNQVSTTAASGYWGSGPRGYTYLGNTYFAEISSSAHDVDFKIAYNLTGGGASSQGGAGGGGMSMASKMILAVTNYAAGGGGGGAGGGTTVNATANNGTYTATSTEVINYLAGKRLSYSIGSPGAGQYGANGGSGAKWVDYPGSANEAGVGGGDAPGGRAGGATILYWNAGTAALPIELRRSEGASASNSTASGKRSGGLAAVYWKTATAWGKPQNYGSNEYRAGAGGAGWTLSGAGDGSGMQAGEDHGGAMWNSTTPGGAGSTSSPAGGAGAQGSTRSDATTSAKTGGSGGGTGFGPSGSFSATATYWIRGG